MWVRHQGLTEVGEKLLMQCGCHTRGSRKLVRKASLCWDSPSHVPPPTTSRPPNILPFGDGHQPGGSAGLHSFHLTQGAPGRDIQSLASNVSPHGEEDVQHLSRYSSRLKRRTASTEG